VPECKHLIDPASACGTCYPPPVPPLPDPSLWGPFFTAARPDECAHCGCDVSPGDAIRADGEGGWLCETCGDDDLGTEFTAWADKTAEREVPPARMAPAELRRRFEEGYT
jgi:hypothetical protein